MKIAIQGIKGSYSEEALLKNFPFFDIEYCIFSQDVFNLLKNDKVDAIFVPVENSIVGPVSCNYNLLLDSQLYINQEFFLKINHCLLSKSKNMKDVKKVISHEIALNQCEKFIHQNNLEIIKGVDTAESSQILSKKDKSFSAIASKNCAQFYNLNILKESIQDEKNNYTRFFLISKNLKIPPNENKISIIIELNDSVGILNKCLNKFSKNNINLSKIESKINPKDPFKYFFIIDFIADYHKQKIDKFLKELSTLGKVKILGIFPFQELE